MFGIGQLAAQTDALEALGGLGVGCSSLVNLAARLGKLSFDHQQIRDVPVYLMCRDRRAGLGQQGFDCRIHPCIQ